MAHPHQEQQFKRLGLSVSERVLLIVRTIGGTDYEENSGSSARGGLGARDDE
jgi:hypothetical protein